MTEDPLEDIDEPTCRICCEVEDSKDDRLISPCKCSGSIKHVHISCLKRWRTNSKNKSNYFRCNVCKYTYNIRRVSIGRLFTNFVAINLVTLLTILFNIYAFAWIIQLYTIVAEIKVKEVYPDILGVKVINLAASFAIIGLVCFGIAMVHLCVTDCADFKDEKETRRNRRRSRREDDTTCSTCIYIGGCPSSGSSSDNKACEAFIAVMILAMALLGILYAYVMLYSFISKRAKYILTGIEDLIVEVDSQDEK